MNKVLKPIFQQTVGFLSGHRAKRKLLVLTYHRVLQDYDEIIDEIDAVQFTQQMETLAEYFNVFSLQEGLDLLRRGELPPNAVCITFDDGYRDNYDVAFPILRALNLPATFFIATGYLGNGMMWNDVVIESLRQTELQKIDLTELSLDKYAIDTVQHKLNLIRLLIGQWRNKPLNERNDLSRKFSQLAQHECNDRMMMTENEVQELANAGMEIGGHTVNHPILSSTHLDEARDEILKGKQHLEMLINGPVKYFAYPSGRFEKDYTWEHAELVRELGFSAALTTNNGAIDQGSALFELPRISIDYTNKFKFGASLARGYVQYAN